MKQKLVSFLCTLILTFPMGLQSQNAMKIDEVEIMNLGDGQRYGHKKDSTKTPLNGKIRLITGFTTEYVDADFKEGFAEGRWDYYLKNELSSYMTFRNGYLDGDCAELKPSGEFKETGSYQKGKKHGTWTQYYSGNKPKQQETYADGDIRKRMSYYTDGNVESERNFLNKKEHGVEKRYDWESGKLKTEKYYENGKQVGKQMQYYSSNLDDYILISHYSKEGKLDGKYTETYVETSKIKTAGEYRDDKKYGIWKYGNKKGQIIKEETYKDGKLTETKKFEN